MTALAYTRAGSGPPLVLLHGIGSWRGAWDPVIPGLAERFDVIAADLPGFGESAPLPAGEPTPAALAAAVAGLLDELGITAAHLAGNSLGGWVALELAGLRPAASVALLSPAGLWRDDCPVYCRVSLRASWWLSRHAGGLLARAVGCRPGRVLVLGQTHGRPAGLDPAYARAAVRALASGPAFDAALRATTRRRYRSGPPLGCPVSLVFGSRDLIFLPRQSRHQDQLPVSTRLSVLPGCGHVPMADNPGAVARFITESAARAHAPA
ncbi:MAG TPA: alpha/beta fold hydrolase [Streptosporangiaceae bacterium]|jgi:pimeloyl-ACP methyl ester carboxylesterase